METITSFIHNTVRDDILRKLPQIVDRKLSFHELESILLNCGNGYRMFIDETEQSEEEWNNLTQKQRNEWNAKAKKVAIASMGSCRAFKKDKSPCTSKAKENGLCGKHRNYDAHNELVKKIAAQPVKTLEKPLMKRKKINDTYYHIDEDMRVFDIKTKEFKGIYNENTKEIEMMDNQFDNSSIESSSDIE